FLIIAANRSVDVAAGDVGQIELAAHPPGARRPAALSGDAAVGIGEAAVARTRQAEARPLRVGNLGLDESGLGVAQLDIRAERLLVGKAGTLVHAGDADADLVVDPVLRAAAIDIAVDLAGHRLVLVL